MILDIGQPQRGPGMLCPHCHEALVMSSREGIEIDYCPKCRGVWLDRGELDKIIERSLPDTPPRAVRSDSSDRTDRDRRDRDDRKSRKKSWLAEIFDELT